MARDILRYFLRNPRAADNFEGIVRWRLLEECVHRNVLDTHKALLWLVRKKYLLKDSRLAFGSVFRLNREKEREIRAFLERARGGTPPPVGVTGSAHRARRESLEV